ncbi:MAG: YvcK family protein [Patescibacteria group bacterium]|nr:YvcK family protein [Patescibacteria group bacterium]
MKTKDTRRSGLKVVIVGGGSGTAVLADLLRPHGSIMATIQSTFDDGGHSGMLRKQYGIPAIGDLGKAILALVDDKLRDGELYKWLSYRHERDGRHFDNTVGRNEFLAMSILRRWAERGRRYPEALIEALDALRKELGVEPEVLPVSLDEAHIKAFPKCRPSTIKGQDTIDNKFRHEDILDIELDPVPPAQRPRLCERAREAILGCDALVFAPGTFWGSKMAPLRVEGFKEAVHKARKSGVLTALVINASRPSVWTGLEDPNACLERYSASLSTSSRNVVLDAAFCNSSMPSTAAAGLKWLEQKNEVPMRCVPSQFVREFITGPFVDWTENGPKHNELFAEELMGWVDAHVSRRLTHP